MRTAVVLLAVTGCRSLLGIEDPVLAADADAASAADASASDAMLDAALMCPMAPSGCDAFQCAGSASCYYACGDRTWGNSQDQCMAAGLGCLVTIDDAAENACVEAATKPVFPESVWIGYSQAASGPEPLGGWTWRCGASSFLPANWGLIEPNDEDGNEDCASMVSGGAWLDSSCSTPLRFVCELPTN